jgi:uncharacterized protein YuzE
LANIRGGHERNLDPKTDPLSVVFKEGPIAESDEEMPGTILDYGKDGTLMSLEILDASRHVTDFKSIQFRVA